MATRVSIILKQPFSFVQVTKTTIISLNEF